MSGAVVSESGAVSEPPRTPSVCCDRAPEATLVIATLTPQGPVMRQPESCAAVDEGSSSTDVALCAAGST